MKHAQHASEQLDAALARLERDKVIELSLDDLDDLIIEPDTPPFQTRRSPYRAGLDDIVLTLSAARRLPDELTVRVVLPPGQEPSHVDAARAALRSRATDMAGESWREAMATRSMGHRQLPLGVAIGIGAAAVAYAAAYFASVVDTAPARGVFIVIAMIALTIAWVVGWVVVEAAILDWRLAARRAAACELLAKATLEVRSESS